MVPKPRKQLGESDRGSNKQKAQRVWAKGERHLVDGTDAEGEEAQDQRGEAWPGV